MTTSSRTESSAEKIKPFDPSHFGAIEISPELRARFLALANASPSPIMRGQVTGNRSRRYIVRLALPTLIFLTLAFAIAWRLAAR